MKFKLTQRYPDYILFIVIAFNISSCDESELNKNTIEPKGVAKVETLNGEKVLSTPSENEIKQLNYTLDAYMAIDFEHPGPLIPDEHIVYPIKNFIGFNDLVLDNDTIIRIAGIECNTKNFMHTYRKMLHSTNIMVVHQPTGYLKDGIVYSYVWEIHDYNTKSTYTDSSFSYTSINESAILSGWCIPIEQNGHDYHQRYISLSKLVK